MDDRPQRWNSKAEVRMTAQVAKQVDGGAESRKERGREVDTCRLEALRAACARDSNIVT